MYFGIFCLNCYYYIFLNILLYLFILKQIWNSDLINKKDDDSNLKETKKGKLII